VKSILISFLVPSLAFCAPVVGTVALLDGGPLAGASIQLGSNAVRTDASGAFVLARTTGVLGASHAPRRMTSNLELRNGRLVLSWSGADALGRGTMAKPEPRFGAARSLAATDTLTVSWNGKRLVVLPVPMDTGALDLRIDTAWKDDVGIPWNPRVDYASLHDARDGSTYRTVKIGDRNWMAENLGFVVRPGAGSWVFGDSAVFTARFGRLYSWATALALPDSCDKKSCSTQVVSRRGICPAGWSIPTDADWTRLVDAVEADPRVGTGMANLALKSNSGWVENDQSTDLFGFRALPSGWNARATYRQADTLANFRSATEQDETTNWSRTFNYSRFNPFVFRFYQPKDYGFPVRCIED
jgi:uncharacterized protein (TIGR02145 family)